MSGVNGKKILLMVLVIAALTIIFPINASSQTFEDPVTYGNFKDLVDEYDEETGLYGALQTGTWVNFTDKIAYCRVNGDGDTEVFLQSTGASPYSPSLVFLGSELKESFCKDTLIDITVQIAEVVDDNVTRQVIAPYNEGVTIITDDGVGEEEGAKVDVFGIEIPIPEKYDTSWARFFMVLAVWTGGTILIWFIFFIALKLSMRTKTVFDEQILGIVTAPFFVILLLYGLLISLSQFDMDPKLIDILDTVYRGTTVIVAAYIAIKIFKRVILVYLKVVSKKTDTQADDILAPFLGKVITVAIWIVAFVMFLKVFNVDITVFVAGMGIIGLVIAFAAQDTLSNFFAGIMILLDRPFKEGDIIMLDDAGYEVKHIGLRSTRLFHGISNRLVTIPNNKISDHMFANLSEPNNRGRKTIEVGVGYDNDPEKVGELLIDIANSHPDTYVEDDHQPFYRFAKFGDSSLNFSLTFWVKDFNDQWRVASELRERIYKRFASEGIDIPFPQRVVHMASAEPVKDEKDGSKPVKGDMKNLGI